MPKRTQHMENALNVIQKVTTMLHDSGYAPRFEWFGDGVDTTDLIFHVNGCVQVIADPDEHDYCIQYSSTPDDPDSWESYANLTFDQVLPHVNELYAAGYIDDREMWDAPL